MKSASILPMQTPSSAIGCSKKARKPSSFHPRKNNCRYPSLSPLEKGEIERGLPLNFGAQRRRRELWLRN